LNHCYERLYGNGRHNERNDKTNSKKWYVRKFQDAPTLEKIIACRCDHNRDSGQERVLRGSPSIQTEPGGPLEAGQPWQTAAGIFYDEIMPCVELAEKLEIFLLIEPEPGLLIERFEQYLEFAGRIASPWIGLNFDIGHAYCVGEDPQDWIARMAPHTRHYHLEDIPPSREHRHMIPGRGAIDFPAVLREIVRSGYAGWVTVELYPYIDNPDQAGREAKRFIEQILVAGV